MFHSIWCLVAQRKGMVITMKKFVQKTIVLTLSLSIFLTNVGPLALASNADSTRILAAQCSDDGSVLSINTGGDTIRIESSEHNGIVTTLQYSNDVLTQEVTFNRSNNEMTTVDYLVGENNSVVSHTKKEYITPSIEPRPLASSAYYKGTVSYTASTIGISEPTYWLSVRVTEYVDGPYKTGYQIPSTPLSVAQTANKIAGMLGIPIGFANKWLGLAIGLICTVSNEVITYFDNKRPVLSCSMTNYRTAFEHHGNAPVYDDGYIYNQYASRAIITDQMHPELSNQVFTEGYRFGGKTTQEARNIYNTMYSYPIYDIVGWD